MFYMYKKMYTYIFFPYMYFIVIFYNFIKPYLDITYMHLHIDEYSDKIIYEYQYNYNLHKKVQLYIKENNIDNFLYVDDKMNKKWNLYITPSKSKMLVDNNSLLNNIHARDKLVTHEKH